MEELTKQYVLKYPRLINVRMLIHTVWSKTASFAFISDPRNQNVEKFWQDYNVCWLHTIPFTKGPSRMVHAMDQKQ